MLELVHVADDAHQAVVARERLQRVDGKPQALVVERTETFVHEHRIELDTARRTLHLVGKAKRQRKRCQEAFATAERLHFAFTAARMVQNVQVEPALALVIGSLHAAHQFVLPVRKDAEADIRTAHDAVEIRRLHVGFEHHLACAREPAIRRIGKEGDQRTFLKQVRQLRDGFLNLGKRIPVLRTAGRYIAIALRLFVR